MGGNMIQKEAIVAIDYKQLYEQSQCKCEEQEALIAELRKENHRLRLREVPLSKWGHEYLANLQYKVKALDARVKAFESCEEYAEMKGKYKLRLAEKEREIGKLKSELADANARNVTMREKWSEVYDDIVKAHAKGIKEKDRKIKAMQERALNAERQRDEGRGRLLEKNRELYEVKTKLEDEIEKNRKLKAQINRDHENSSISSSLKPNRKKIHNSREKSGKKPGGQPGHKGHCRKKQEPTKRIEIPPPAECVDNPDYKPTGKTITKQLIGIRVELVVNEYSTKEFRHTRTWERVHADFPDGVVNDVNYDGSVKAFAFLLNSRCNVSIVNTSDFLSELTGGKLKISTGMICGLTKEFSLKSETEQKEAFADLLLSPVMCTDMATVRVNGKNVNVALCTAGATAMYFAREHKGHEGVKGTPVENYQHTLVHDHDKTYYSYGGKHAECNQHPLRYLKGIIENELGLHWAKQMRELIQEMIHFKNSLEPEDKRDPVKIDSGRVKAFETQYDEILALAKYEYDYEPPSKYNMDGFNLYKKLEKYKDNHLLFLHDRRVPATNNISERLLRIIKRKLAQVMTFRSQECLGYLCNSLGVVASLRAKGSNLYVSVASIYDRVIAR
jgi:hypothetical protein